MSYPNIIYGDYGDEKATAVSALGGLPLGQLMILPDGRKFRHAQVGAASLNSGVIVACSAGLADHGSVAASGLQAAVTTTYNQIGDTTVHLLSNTVTAITKDMYADGFLNVLSGSGAGHTYRVKGNSAVTGAATATSADFTVTLDTGDPLKVAFAAVTTTAALRKSNFKDAIPYSTSAAIAPPMGVTPTPVTAAYYFWVARSGPTAVRTCATSVIDGQPMIQSPVVSGSAAPAVSRAASGVIWADYLGIAMQTVNPSAAALVDLRFE